MYRFVFDQVHRAVHSVGERGRAFRDDVKYRLEVARGTTPYRSFGPGGLIQVNRFTGALCAVGESCWQERRESYPPLPNIPPRSR